MGKIILSWVNHVRDTQTELSASEAAGVLPVMNVADPRVGKRWRASLNAWGQADFGGDVTCGVFALRFPRDVALPGGTVRHLLDEDGGTAGAGAADDSGAIPLGLADGYGYHVWRPDAARTLRTWRFQYAASGVLAVDTGLAWAGPAWQPKINVSFNLADTWRDLSRITESQRSGVDFVDEGPRRRLIAFSLDRLDETEAATMADMARIAGISRPVLAIIDPDDAPRQTIIGKLTETTPLRYPKFDIRSKVFEIKEDL